MKNLKSILTLFIPVIVLLIGCKGCDDQFNNKDSNPKELWLGMNGTDVATQIENELGNNCTHPNMFLADIDVKVLTASQNGTNVTLDPNPYWTYTYEDKWFLEGSVTSNNLTKIKIQTPETGGFGLDITLKSKSCSNCCKDKDFLISQNNTAPQDIRCDGNSATNICPTGKPTLSLMKIFKKEERPETNETITINLIDEFIPTICRSCDNCPTTSCN